MKLKELIKEHPSVETEIEDLQSESYNKGVKETQEKINSRVEKASGFVANSNYPKSIQELALDVIKGEKDAVSLEAAVAAYDSSKESTASTAAAKETNGQVETPGQQVAAVSQDGVVKTEEDLDAVVAEDRKRHGISEGGK